MPTYTAADGASLHYDELGDRSGSEPPIVVLAGGAALHPRYLGDLAGLSTEHPLVVPHLRGVGHSPAPVVTEDGSYWRQAADLELLRVHLGLDQLVIVGHSAGTRLAIAYAAQHPDGVARMLLITPPSAYLVDEPSDTDQIIDARRGDPVFDAALAAQAAGPDLAGDDTFNAWQQATAPIGYAEWSTVAQHHARHGHFSLAAARAYFSVDPPADLAEQLGAIEAPVLVMAGGQDCSTGVTQLRALADLFPAGEFVVIDRCGHFPWVEQPAEFRRAADAFLAPARSTT